jgi:hypothetical protein
MDNDDFARLLSPDVLDLVWIHDALVSFPRAACQRPLVEPEIAGTTSYRRAMRKRECSGMLISLGEELRAMHVDVRATLAASRRVVALSRAMHPVLG